MGRPIKNLASLFFIVLLSLLMFSRLAYSTQKTFVLDPDNPIFRYEEYALNNTNTSENLIFTSSKNITRYITIPKNSTIIDSNITLLGKIMPIQTTGSGVAFYTVALGNVTSGIKNDIGIGAAGEPHVTLYDSSLNKIWDFNISSGTVNSISIGDVNTSSTYSEVAIGTDEGKVYLLDSNGNELWSYTATDKINSVFIGDITSDDGNEIACGGDDLKLSILNSSGNLKWSYQINSVINDIAVGDVNSTYSGNEIVVGAGGSVYIFNSSGNSIRNITISNTVNAIAVGDVTSDTGNEIVIGTNNGTVYTLTDLGEFKWNYNIGTAVYSVSIGDTTFDSGNEIAVGSGDDKIYELDSSGDFIWSYTTGNDIRGVAIGDITIDSLNETVGVSIDQNVYVLNFNYYPTNTSIDVGGDGDYDWSSVSEKLRTYTDVTNSSIGEGIQDYLDSCGTQTCNVPFVFHSDAAGNLNITSVNINYNYNASESITSQLISNIWSKTNNIYVNSSLGYQVKNISYNQNPANNIIVDYVRVDNSATSCDFGGLSYSSATEEGVKVCDISSNNYQILSSGSLPEAHKLWDSTMTTDIPTFLNTTIGQVNTTGVWIKNMTIYTNVTSETETFYNVTANTTLDENYVTSDEILLVYWSGSYHDITPSSGTSDCDSDSPTYTKKTLGSDDFFVCKEDTNSNGVYDFFKWKQAHTSSVDYKMEGASNYPLDLTNINVNSTSAVWGTSFNFSVDVGDYEEDNATVTLLIYFEGNSSWERIETKNLSTNNTVWFVLTSDRTWTGDNQYKFEYRDYNKTTGTVFHLWQNTSSSEFNVTKHPVQLIYISGHNSQVNRTGTNSTELVVRVNDTSNASYVGENVNCSFWITTDDGSTLTLAKQTSTDSTGYCNFTFDPDSTYQAYNQVWVAGVDNEAYYNSSNTSNYNVKIHVPLNISFHTSTVNANTTRGNVLQITAGIYDEEYNIIEQNGYTCTWYLNNSQASQTVTNSSGYCSYAWSPTCSNSTGLYPTNITLSGTPYDYYHIINNKDYTNIRLKDTLSITIILPVNDTIYHEQKSVTLESAVSDSCGVPNETYLVGWYFQKSGACPSSNPVVIGDNTSWNLAPSCEPRQISITANATGESYESGKDYARIYIYGWAQINMTSPTAGNITNRSTDVSSYVDLFCRVKDNITTSDIQSYAVSFFDGTEFLATRETNSSGYANYTWNITSNVTVPEGNHTLKCNISENSTAYYNVSVNESTTWMIIRGGDFNSPFFNDVHATSTEPYNNVTIEANVTDWGNVDNVWSVVTYPNTTNMTYYLSNITSNIMSGTWRATIVNISNIGGYDYIIYANDTNNQTNSTIGWFDIYTQLYFWGNATNNDNKNLELNFTFYRPGTNEVMDIVNTSHSGGSYNFSVFKANVDLKVKIIDHEIFFRNLNITASAITQFDENATNITNPLAFDNVSVQDILLQATTKNKMTVLVIDSNLDFDNATITLNFTKNLNDYSDLSKPALRIYKCSSWQLDNRSGCDGSWTQLTTTLNNTANTVTVNTTNMSAYIVAEYCPSCDSGGDDGNDGSGSGGGGGGGGVKAVCGNGICEATENVDNCPEDCGKAERAPFTVKTNLTDVEIEVGRTELYSIWIKNTHNDKINTSIHFSGSIFHFLSIEDNFIELDINEEKMIPIYVTIPLSADPAVYTGEIVISGQGYTQRTPATITVPYVGSLDISVVVESLTKKVNPNGTAVFHVLIYNLGFRNKVNISVNYLVKELESNNVILRESEKREIEASLPLIKNVHIPGNTTLGEYSYEVEVEFHGKKISSADTFNVVKPFWTPERLRFVMILAITICVIVAGYYVRKLYRDWRLSKVRYIFPVDSKTLPKGKLNIGQIAETNQKTTFEMNELKTHILTAGATGSGKSVSAMTMVEELLEKKIPVVVFDPTAQWTGFVRPCKDSNLLKFYKKFGMNLRDVKPYKGMIYEVTDPKVEIDFKKYMNPGEITIFTLDKLKPGQYDQAVKSIINIIFEQGWEESTKLQLVIVFDEVHRLLEKYGGKGGYVSLEKACREFRKWGIGLIMISQVLSDFKEAIKGNVLTEVQLHTKSLGDLQRIEQKFGEDYAKRVTRLEVGIGMVQNPKYNKGKPYFVSFRPTYHSPHKIPDKELQMYKEYEKMLKEVESEIEILKKSGKDIFGLNVELKLAKDKLKKGRFRMAKIYIDSLTKSLNREKK